MNEGFDKLTAYTLALKRALEETTEANERPLLINRLAAAAQIYALLHDQAQLSAVRDLVESEARAHGWSFLSAPYGEDIAAKWVAFTDALGITRAGS